MECLPQWSSNSLLLFVAVVVAAADVVAIAAAVVAVVVAVRGERFPKRIYTNSRSTAPGGHYVIFDLRSNSGSSLKLAMLKSSS